MSKLVLWVMAVVVLSAGPGFCYTHPNMFVNQEEINGIKAKLGTEPWKTDYARMLADANSSLTAGTQNVMGGVVSPSGNKHEFYTEKYYGTNPDRTDCTAASRLGKAVRSLGLAYALSGQAKYADKALKFIYDWCFNPSTYMTPTKLGVSGNAQPVLDVSLTLPQMYYGADLIWNYPGWTKARVGFSKAEFQTWVKTLCLTKYAIKSPNCANNWQDWNHVMYAASMVIIENEALLGYLFNGVKALYACKMNTQGRMEKEYTRGGGISYSLFSITPILLVAEIARHHGVDMYHYKSGVKGMELALDYIEPYVKNPATWPWKEQFSTRRKNLAAFELGYFCWHKQKYVDRIKQYGRPIENARIIGYIALTHSYGARPWKVYQTSGTTGIDNIRQDKLPEELNVIAFPNPMQNKVVFCLSPGMIGTVRIYDQAGNMIFNNNVETIHELSLQIIWDGTDIAGRPVKPGIYLYRVFINGEIYSGKIIKTR